MIEVELKIRPSLVGSGARIGGLIIGPVGTCSAPCPHEARDAVPLRAK